MKQELFIQVRLSKIRDFWYHRKGELAYRPRPSIKDEVRRDIYHYCMEQYIRKLVGEVAELSLQNSLLATSNQALAATVAYYESRNINE